MVDYAPMDKLRTHLILDYLKAKKRCTLPELMRKFKVSSATIHRDAEELARRDAVSKVRGGLVWNERMATVQTDSSGYQERIIANRKAKMSIAQMALDLVTEGDILTLVMLLNKHIKKANADCETSMGSMYLSRRIDLKRRTNGALISCFLYVNSHYFERRECISFNADGWIGFASWADQGNTNPILRAFIEWCDALAATKEKEDTQQ